MLEHFLGSLKGRKRVEDIRILQTTWVTITQGCHFGSNPIHTFFSPPSSDPMGDFIPLREEKRGNPECNSLFLLHPFPVFLSRRKDLREMKVVWKWKSKLLKFARLENHAEMREFHPSITFSSLTHSDFFFLTRFCLHKNVWRGQEKSDKSGAPLPVDSSLGRPGRESDSNRGKIRISPRPQGCQIPLKNLKMLKKHLCPSCVTVTIFF